MSAAPDSLDTAMTAAQAASDKLATDIVAIDVSEQLVITDVFVICSGANERQVKSIVDAIEEALHAKGVKPIRREGVKGAHWVLLDFGDVVVHVQQAEDREEGHARQKDHAGADRKAGRNRVRLGLTLSRDGGGAVGERMGRERGTKSERFSHREVNSRASERGRDEEGEDAREAKVESVCE